MSATISLGSAALDLPRPVKPRARKAPAAKKTKSAVRPAAKSTATEETLRTSQILRNLLTNNPGVEHFSVAKILSEIGATSFGTSLMFFSIPEVLPIPIPGISAIMVLPTGAISIQLATGKKQVALPKFLLERTVPRKALAGALVAILPILERAEKVTKPRWKWATTPASQRFLGLFIFLLALAIAVPIPGFNMPQAIAIFTIGLGLVEKDGVIICLGVLIGLASLILLGGVLFGVSSLLGF